MAETEPTIWIEVVRIYAPFTIAAIALVGQILVWVFQTLAQRAWTEYVHRRHIYLEIVRLIDSLFESGPKQDRVEYLRNIRKVWVVGSDEVIEAANKLSDAIKKSESDRYEELYQCLIFCMRNDLQKRHWFPPSKSNLDKSAFKIEGAGN